MSAPSENQSQRTGVIQIRPKPEKPKEDMVTLLIPVKFLPMIGLSQQSNPWTRDQNQLINKIVPLQQAGEIKEEILDDTESTKIVVSLESDDETNDTGTSSTINPFVCPVCRESFNRPYFLKRHTLVHASERPEHCCQYCDKHFTDLLSLNAHLRTLHGIALIDKQYKCKTCNEEFASSSLREQHMETVHEEILYSLICEQCGKVFKNKDNLQKHLKTHDKNRKVRIKSHQCHLCELLFYTGQELKEHIFCHSSGEKPWKCEVCKKTFTKSSHLKVHSYIHTGEKRFQCEVCGKRVITGHELKSHSRVHTGERPYNCDYCERTFAAQCNYKRHIRLAHIGGKDFICEHCGKQFAEKIRLRDHIMTHTGERPFECKMCGSRFNNSSQLIRHKRTHTGEKRHACPVCGPDKRYSRPPDLKHHIRTIHAENAEKILLTLGNKVQYRIFPKIH